MPQYRHPVTSRHPPTPTCCPQEPGGHLRQRYSPWIRANHLQCQFPSKRDGSVDNGSDDENPSSSSHTDTGRNSSLTLSNTTFANVNGGSAGPEPEPESTTDITTMSGDESTVEPEVELTCIGRFQHVSNVDLKWLKNKIEQEFHEPGTFSFFGTRMLSIDDHPLVQQYNKRRAAMIAAGEPAPEELSLDKLEWSLANKMNLRSSPSTVHIDHNGTEVHTGFRGPPLVRRSSSYSNCDTFAKWRFADADVNFDTEVTRLKEFGDSRASSTVKLVLAEQRDPVVGTGPFMEANKPATQPQSKMLNDEFNQFLQNHKRTIKFSSDVDLAKAKQTVTASAVSTDSESEDDPDSLILSKPSDDTDGTNQTDLTSSDTDTTTLTKIEDVRAPRSPSQLKTSKRVYDLYAYWIEASNENGITDEECHAITH